ncbi:MAG: nucleotidyltransferase domain-containing protein [Candidatus Helarchaeota archaeon]
MRNTIAREGCFIETKENLIFDVKGCIHPPDRIIAYLRYYPDASGNRIKNNVKYKKIYSLNERTQFLLKNYNKYIYFDPFFNIKLQGVPLNCIKKVYDPLDFRNQLKVRNNITNLQKSALEFIEILIDSADINEKKIGVSGSLMISLELPTSDIDILIYGTEDVIKLHKKMDEIFEMNNKIKRYTLSQYKKLYEFKSKDTQISWDDFIKIEVRKKFQGTYNGIDFFIRGVKDWNEIDLNYGDFKIKNLGRVYIKAIVEDSSDSVFTPCIYKIKDSEIIKGYKEDISIDVLFSYRGRFNELLNTGDIFTAYGNLEKITLNSGKFYYRLILGGNKEDFLKLAH